MESSRKKSPRAPSLSLDEAISKALMIYERERLYAISTEVAAQAMGYKGANNGSALAALASLRYFGLLERPRDGFLAICKEVEAYQFAPQEEQRQQLRLVFLKTPSLYAELLEAYPSGLPSSATLRYDLIQRGFAPQAAEAAISAFLRSVEFAGYYEGQENFNSTAVGENPSIKPQINSASVPVGAQNPSLSGDGQNEMDKIPVRLSGGRKAWIIVPSSLLSADIARLQAQLNLLLVED